ncbi:MAG: AlwI family type II restriction endonuclease [Clostridiales Family XIII bacterium]|jgi:hypothetical protein|nr:AlwI family type II restriction endonuclease [Clostridiales Family XIII bacterium]
MAEAKYKPLSFTTTLRNPERIVDFLKILAEFEGKILTNSLIENIAKRLFAERLYVPKYISRTPRLKAIYDDEELKFSDDDLQEILENSPQQHKERGFDNGYPSRFDTWYKFLQELGFIKYAIDESIRISNTGNMLLNAYNEETPNGEKIQAVYLNAMIKYQTANPYRKTLNENAPLILLLQVIKLLKDDKDQNGAGIARRELPLVICWTDNNTEKLYKTIVNLRRKHGFEYSDDLIYKLCFKKLQGEYGKDENYLKKVQITKELPDDFLRKVRMTGVISLRGMGRFVDFNGFEKDKIDYILKKYATYKKYTTKEDYFAYMGEVDTKILEFAATDNKTLDTVRQKTLKEMANIYGKTYIDGELTLLTTNGNSKDSIFSEINEPTRLEFLTAIALKQTFPSVDVRPNYIVDDEGFPIFTAKGGVADIECYDKQTNSLFEVTLMRGKTQAINEMPAITRHLRKQKTKFDGFVFSVLIAPSIHFDTVYMAEFSKTRYNINIIPLSISEFIEQRNSLVEIKEFST